MPATTSSRSNYNIMALRGANIDDMEYVETFGLDPELAYTPQLNDVMLDMIKQQNMDGGMEEAEANSIRSREEKNIRRLLAQNGMLKRK